MKNKITLVFFIFLFDTGFCQMIESTSRPYRFDIDKILEYEGVSSSKDFEIIPARVKIRSMIEVELSIWYKNEGFKYADQATYNERIIRKIEEFQPNIIHQVGVEEFNNCIPEYYFLQNTLQFEIHLNGFRPFNIAIPLAEVESFKLNFSKLEYSEQIIAFNEQDEFVITYLKIYNPDNGKKYVFYNTEDQTIKAPSFAISVPESEL